DDLTNHGGGVWGLDRCWGGRDRRDALPGAPPRGFTPCLDRPRGLLRFYPGPAGRAPDRRGAAHDSLAAECVLDLAAARERRGAAFVSRYGASTAVAGLRHGAPGCRCTMWRAADRVPGRARRGRAPHPAPARHG